MADAYFDQDNITALRVLLLVTTIYLNEVTGDFKNILTTAVTFAQAALAGLNRRSSAGVAGCITRPTPLLSSCPAGDCALCPL